MSKKLDLLRRSEVTKSFDGSNILLAHQSGVSQSHKDLSKLTTPSNTKSLSAYNADQAQKSIREKNHNTFRTFFHRIGSTGMLTNKSNNTSTSNINHIFQQENQQHRNTKDKKQQKHHDVSSIKSSSNIEQNQQFYRSNSTSQLNVCCSYVKCDDPSDGINLNNETNNKSIMSTITPQPLMNGQKSSSCDDLAKVSSNDQQPKKANFPYAFLRSKLSVLPEENGGSVVNQKRLSQNLSRMSISETTGGNSNGIDLATGNNITAASSIQSLNNVNYTRQNSLKHSATEETISNLSNSPPRIIGQGLSDWDQSYQRLSSCLSSNESGYDSDSGRHDPLLNISTETLIPLNDFNKYDDFQLRRYSELQPNEMQQRQLSGSRIKRRFQQIRLNKSNPNDKIGLELIPQYFNKDNDEITSRYIISTIELNGLAHR